MKENGKIIGTKAPEVESYSSRCCDRKPGKASRGRKGLLCFAAGESSPSRWRSLGSRPPVVWKWSTMLAGVLFIQSRTLVLQIVLLTFSVGFLSPVNPVKVTPHRQRQSFVSRDSRPCQVDSQIMINKAIEIFFPLSSVGEQ